jgi:LacI family transcriptional regulator
MESFSPLVSLTNLISLPLVARSWASEDGVTETKTHVTIKDVASFAGVSPATVSRVLNDSGYVGEATRRRVEEAIVGMGYRPDARARGLRGMPSKLVALIIPDILNVYYTSVAKAIEHHLAQLGYIMLLGITSESAERYIDYLHFLWERKVDGIIYVPPAQGDYSDHTRRLVRQGIPFVEINRQRETDLLDCVLADNLRGAYRGTQHLIGLGHRRIALVVGSPETTTGADRIQGFKHAMREAGLEIDPQLLKIGSFSKDHGFEATEELLSLSSPPTAIFSTSNRLLMGTMTALARHSVHVPNQVSVLSFDDSEWLGFFQPPITTVDIAVEEMGMLAVELLMRWIREGHPPDKPRTYSLSIMLVERDSCKPVVVRPEPAPAGREVGQPAALSSM